MNAILERYLMSRGIYPVKLPASISGALRLHPGLKHPSVGLWPAMIGKFTPIEGVIDETCGIHRTFLAPDGTSKAPVEPQKMMLGIAKGAVIKTSPDEEVITGLGICEGIETALSVLAAGWAPMWACGSAGTIADFPVLAGKARMSCRSFGGGCVKLGGHHPADQGKRPRASVDHGVGRRRHDYGGGCAGEALGSRALRIAA